MPLLPFARAERGLAKVLKKLKGPPILWCLPIAPYPQRLTHALRGLAKVRSRHVAKNSLTRTRACLNPILQVSTTIPLSSLESCLHVLNQTAKKLHPATLDDATPYANTQRFLPPPWNDMTHGVQQLCAHHVHQTLDGGDPCPLGRLNFLACGTNHSKNIAKKGCRQLEEGVRKCIEQALGLLPPPQVSLMTNVLMSRKRNSKGVKPPM